MSYKKEELLLLAIGEIDDDLIEEATVPYVRPRIFTPKGISAIAASFILIIGIFLGIRNMDLFKFMDAYGGNAAPESSNNGTMDGNEEGSGNASGDYVGSGDLHDPVTSITIDGGTLTLTDSGGYRYGFTLTVTEQIPKIDAIFRVFRDGEEFTVSTEGAPHGYGEVIGSPNVYVNGVISSEIPTSPGVYEISFDLSEFTDNGYDIGNRILIEPFGTFDTISFLGE